MFRQFIFCFLLALPMSPALALDQEAERFVRLALELGLHDQHYVDAYIGPPEWRESAEAARRDARAVAADIGGLLARLEA